MKKIVIALLIVFIVLIGTLKTFNFSNKPTVIKFSSWGSNTEVLLINDVIKKFEEQHPDIKIEFIHIPQNYFQKIHLLFASSLEPDIIFINNQYIPMYIKAGLIEDLTPYFENIDNIYYNEALKCFRYNNALYAIPRDISNLVIYYNKDIFKEKNIKIKGDLKSIYELKALAEKVTTDKYFGVNTEENSLYWLSFLASNGGGALSDDLKSVIINHPESLQALNLYSDFSNKYHISPTKSQIGSMTTAQMFINRKLAMYIGGSWMVPKFRETITFDWDVMPFPSSIQNKIYIDSSGWAMSKKSKNKDKALIFLKYLSDKNSIDIIAKSGLIIPARMDSAKDLISDRKNLKPANSKIFISVIAKSKPTPVNENYPYINDILNEKSLNIFTSGHDAKDVFDFNTIKKLESYL